MMAELSKKSAVDTPKLSAALIELLRPLTKKMIEARIRPGILIHSNEHDRGRAVRVPMILPAQTGNPAQASRRRQRR